MAPTRMSFEVSLGHGDGHRREGDAPLRMLVLADLGGDRAVALQQRRTLPIDIDNFDRVLARIAPRATVELDGLAVDLTFASIDDFHPDALCARLPVFAALRRLRGELDDPAQLRRAAAALGLTPTPTPPASPAAASAEADADIARLLGRPASSNAAPAPSVSVTSMLDQWLRERIAPHVLPDLADEQRVLRRAADDALGATMRRLLQEPRLMALEAAWRGVDALVRGLELGESMHLLVLDAARDEIAADLAAHGDDLSGSALHGLLNAPGAPDDQRIDLLVLDFAFGPDATDVRQLAALGALAARGGATLLASATPQLAGAHCLADLADPRRWTPPDSPAFAHWNALRTSPMAAWIGLALPRVLLRLPYGAASDPITAFEFDEMPSPREHEAYLWGLGGLALALLLGRAFQQDGWAMRLASSLDLEGLPSHVVVADGEKHQQPCAELLMPEVAGQALLARGLMPLMSWRGRNAVRLLGWQSIADPPAPLAALGT